MSNKAAITTTATSQTKNPDPRPATLDLTLDSEPTCAPPEEAASSCAAAKPRRSALGGVPAASSSVPSGAAAGSGQSTLSPERPWSIAFLSCETVGLGG